MRIIKDTDDQFVLEEKPVFLGLVFIFFLMSGAAWAVDAYKAGNHAMLALALLLIVGMGVFAARVVERIWLIFDRAKGTIEIRRRNHRDLLSETYPLADLAAEGIMVERSGDMNRLALKLSSHKRPIPMTQHYQTGNHIVRCADAAKAWLAKAG